MVIQVLWVPKRRPVFPLGQASCRLQLQLWEHPTDLYRNLEPSPLSTLRQVLFHLPRLPTFVVSPVVIQEYSFTDKADPPLAHGVIIANNIGQCVSEPLLAICFDDLISCHLV